MTYRLLNEGETPRRGDHRRISVWSAKLGRWVRRFVWSVGDDRPITNASTQVYRRRVNT